MIKHVVTITGGTGGYKLLRGLAKYDVDITAVFSPFDSGGSAGAIREEFGGISWGDIRRGLAALAPDEEPYLTIKKIFEHRFDKDSSLKGHNLGNLLLLALKTMEENEEAAIRKAEKLLGLPEGRRVMPSTFDKSVFMIELENGQVIEGGRQIAEYVAKSGIKKLFLRPRASAHKAVLGALRDADIIVIGPGAFYNSVIPNLLVEGIPEAIKRSRAETVFVCNTVTEFGQTEHMKASDFVKDISKYLRGVPTYSVFNNSFVKGQKGKETHRDFVKLDVTDVKKTGTEPIIGDFIDGTYEDRHDSEKLARVIMGLL